MGAEELESAQDGLLEECREPGQIAGSGGF